MRAKYRTVNIQNFTPPDDKLHFCQYAKSLCAAQKRVENNRNNPNPLTTILPVQSYDKIKFNSNRRHQLKKGYTFIF